MIKKLIILGLAILVCACEQNIGSEEQIYEVMDFMLKDQKLDKTHGLKLEPELQCSLDGPDKEFLKNLIEPPTKDTTALDSTKLKIVINYEFHLGQLTKCLTVGDVDYMIKQKDKNINFKWNNSKLGFDLNNKKNWYQFSTPMFSKDGTKAVMMVRDLCEGLCGQGWTLLLTNENGKWRSETGGTWWH